MSASIRSGAAVPSTAPFGIVSTEMTFDSLEINATYRTEQLLTVVERTRATAALDPSHLQSSQGGNMFYVQALDYPGASLTTARKLNNVGQAVGEAYSLLYPLVSRAVLWNSVLPVDIWPKTKPPYGASPRAEGINDSGDVVISGNFDAFLYRGGVMTPSPAMKQRFVSVFPKDINNHGLITGIAAGTDVQDWAGFIYDSKTDTPPVVIPNPADGKLEGVAINNNGQVVCKPHGDISDRVYLYSNGELRDLFSASMVNDLNDAGQTDRCWI